MRRLDSYLNEYQESHQNPLNVKIHNICVPLIMWSILAFLTTFSAGPLPASVAFLLFVTAYYTAIASLRTVIAMAAISLAMIYSTYWIPSVRFVAVIVFIVAWIGQFYGHKVEEKKPSFLKDLFFLLIGPIWVLKKLAPELVG